MENRSIRYMSAMGVFRHAFNNLLIVSKVISILTRISFSTNVHGQDSTHPGRSIHFGKEIRAGHHKNGTHIFTTFNGISVNRCTKQCDAMAECAYVNYRRAIKMCYIIRVSGENVAPQILVEPGSIFGLKAEWPVEPASTDPFQVCGPAAMQGATITGNMYQVGNKLLLQCNQFPKWLTDIRCLESGNWSVPDFSCYPPEGFVDHCSYSGELWIRPGLACYVLLYEEEIIAAQAENKCQNLSGHLVDIGDHDEHYYINRMLDWYLEKGIQGVTYGVWIGLNDIVQEGMFQWSDGTVPDYSSWNSPKEPDGGTSENCVVTERNTNYRWADVVCDRSFFAICEIEFL